MTSKNRLRWRSFQGERPVLMTKAVSPATVGLSRAKNADSATPTRNLFLAALEECAGKLRTKARTIQRMQRMPQARAFGKDKPAEPQTAPLPASASPLRRALSWLRTRWTTQTAGKRLRVVETVALGEKRFVAIIQADGRKFLIGGGAQNVALLTQLGAVDDPAGVGPSLCDPAEHSA